MMCKLAEVAFFFLSYSHLEGISRSTSISSLQLCSTTSFSVFML